MALIPLLLSALFSLPTHSAAQVNLLWPQPQSIRYGVETLNLDPVAFTFKSTCAPSKILEDAFGRYRGIIFGDSSCTPALTGQNTRSRGVSASRDPSVFVNGVHDGKRAYASLVTLDVCASSASEQLQLGVDESYTISIQANTSSLHSKTLFGALRGLETFSQLVQCSNNGAFFFINSSPLTIIDAPRFPWRGLLIDTSRHFLPLRTILNTIDALAFVKMNTLHWHAVDAQVRWGRGMKMVIEVP